MSENKYQKEVDVINPQQEKNAVYRQRKFGFTVFKWCIRESSDIVNKEPVSCDDFMTAPSDAI